MSVLASDPRRRRSDRWRWVASAAFVLAAAAIFLSAWLYVRIVREGAQRRDQSCKQSERQELVSVDGIRRTYEFLDELPLEEWGKPLTVAIVRGLPAQEDQARADFAPAFCDEPGAGLPEPKHGDPPLPEHQDFTRLLKPAS